MNTNPSGAEPEQFGPYAIYERLGMGGMATVHRAKKHGIAGFERGVALKRMLSHLTEDPEFVDSFIREAKVASLLVHPNIAQIYDFGRINGIYYIAMEHVDGFDVRKLLRHAHRTSQAIPLGVVVSLLGEICDALEFAHAFTDEHGTPLGIVHRDISPSNLIVAHTGHLKVIDFGIAKASSRQLQTESGRVKGKFAYMAPEAALGNVLGAVSDVFSLGVVAHELLTLQPLFSAKTDFETILRIREAEIPPPSHDNPSCPPALDDIVLAALARDPASRLPSAGAFRATLDEMAAHAGIRVSAREVAEWMSSIPRSEDAVTMPSRRTSRPPSHAPPPASFSARMPPPADAATSVSRKKPTTTRPPFTQIGEGDPRGSQQRPASALPLLDFSVSVPPPPPPPVADPDARFGADAPPRGRRKRTLLVLVPLALGITGGVAYSLLSRTDAPAVAVSAGPASLRFVVEPADAIIEIGGEEVTQRSPFETTLAPGVYSLSVRQPGYKTWSESITVIEGETKAINVALERGVARLAIDSQPRGLAVEIDGKPGSQTTPLELDIASGTHHLKVTSAAGEVWTQEFLAESDGKYTYTAPFASAEIEMPPDTDSTVAAATPKPRIKDRDNPRRDRVRRRDRDDEDGEAEDERDAPAEATVTRPDPPPDLKMKPPRPDPLPTPPPPPPDKPARTPVVAASTVNKLSGDIPSIKGTTTNSAVLAKLCIDERGRVTDVTIKKVSAAIAAELRSALKQWRYKPYLDASKQPSPVCFPLRVVFKRAD